MKAAVAQEKFAKTLTQESEKVASCFWKLSGDDPNSLSRFLGLTWSELREILVLCAVCKHSTWFMDRNNLATLFRDRCGFKCTLCKHQELKAEWFVKVGKGKEVTTPQENHDAKGELMELPMVGDHVMQRVIM